MGVVAGVDQLKGGSSDRMNPLLKRVLGAGVAVGLFAAGVGGYWLFVGHEANAVSTNAARKPPASPVIGGVVEQKPMPVQLTAIGTVQPVNSVAIRARIDSQISKVFVHDGDAVEAGAPLFELDRRQLEAQRAQAESVLAKDQAQLAYARRNLERHRPQISSQAAIDEARTSVETLQAAVQADRANLQSLDVQLSYTHIVAPISGRLGTIAYKVGSTVKASDPQPLVTLNQLRPVYVAFSVPQISLAAVQQAMAAGPVRVEAVLPGAKAQPEPGRLSYVENAVDASTNTISVKARFPNDRERLWPGAYVNVRATLHMQPDALVVPARAVQMGQKGPFVFRIRDDDTVQVQGVHVNRTIGDEAVIDQGLRGGERIVVEGQLRLKDGSRVQVQDATGERRS